jgi:hypothetical protein
MTQSVWERIREDNKRLATEKDASSKKVRVHFANRGLQGSRAIRLQILTAAKAELDRAEWSLSALKRRTVRVAEFMQERRRCQSQKGMAERALYCSNGFWNKFLDRTRISDQLCHVLPGVAAIFRCQWILLVPRPSNHCQPHGTRKLRTLSIP